MVSGEVFKYLTLMPSMASMVALGIILGCFILNLLYSLI